MERPFRAYKGTEPYVFASYSHLEDDLVYDDLLYFHNQDIRIWYDEGIEPGADWRDELADAIADCSLFIFFVSQRSIESAYCRQEINFALNRERRILLIYLEKTHLPRALEFSLADRQAIARYNYTADDYHDVAFSAITDRAQFGRRSTSAHKNSDRSIAVLPLLTIGTDDDFLGEGIAAELATGLSKIRDIKIVPRALAFAQADNRDDPIKVAANLGVRHVLDGTLRRAGSRLRVTTELIDVELGGASLWSERYDRVFEDIFDVQEDIANAVTEALRSEFGIGLGREMVDVGTRDPVAYQAYLQACHVRFRLTPEGVKQTTDFLREAVAADPEFLEGYLLLLTMLEAGQIFYGGEAEKEIESLEQRARALDFGRNRVNWFWNERNRSQSTQVFTVPSDDETLFREMIFHADHPAAQGLNPNRWYFAGFGVDDVAEPVQRAIACYALMLAQAGLYRLALSFFQKSGCDSLAAGCCIMGLSEHEGAREFLAAYGERRPDVVLNRIGHASALHRLDRSEDASVEEFRLQPILNEDMRNIVLIHGAYYRKDFKQLEKLSVNILNFNVPIFFKGLVTLFTDMEAAIEIFHEAYESGDVLLKSIRLFIPLYLPIEVLVELDQQPRFAELMSKIGLDAAWMVELEQRAKALAMKMIHSS